MSTMQRARALVPAALAMIFAVTPARADGSASEAEVLFRDALALMKAGKHAEACPKLARSQELDPGAGTQFRLAECYEATGRIATAWALFDETVEAAKKAGRKDREAQSTARAEALRPRLPMLTVRVEPGAAVQITLDGAPLPVSARDQGRPVPVDPGDHTLSASTPGPGPGKAPWTRAITLRERQALTVTVPRLDEAPPEGAPGPNKALVIVGAGIAALSLGGAIASSVVSNGKASDADAAAARLGRSGCYQSTSVACGELMSLNRAGDTFHDLAIAAYVVAGAATGATLAYALWPRKKAASPSAMITPWIGAGLAGASIQGTLR